MGTVIGQGEIISYVDMCKEEGTSLQRGMNFRLHGSTSVILMSRRANAPYVDRIEDEGRTLIYEGHDIPRSFGSLDPKTVDQPMMNPGGSLTANGLFYKAAQDFKQGRHAAELVRVYEKIHAGIWVFNGVFRLTDAYVVPSGSRKVFRFRLQLTDDAQQRAGEDDLPHDRMIPTSVKLEVWQRDRGRCVRCGSIENLHFDHIIPYSRGGSSLVASNIQLLCARHNLQKSDRIE